MSGIRRSERPTGARLERVCGRSVGSSQPSATMHTYKPHGEHHQTDEYVENFELDHFEFIKREPAQKGPADHVEILPACDCGHWPDSPLPQPYVAIAVVATQTPPLARNCYTEQDIEELHRREPLDMRTFEELNHRDWRQREYTPDQVVNPSSNMSSQAQPRGDQVISDYMLLTLSVPELHKRLHGFPRHDVSILKKKRRTLKNRGYAQDCRSKRLQKRQELEMMNRSLQDELHLLQMQVARVTHERDVLKKRLALVDREHAVHYSYHAPTPHSQGYPEL